jgi:Helix-turn-helix domain
MRETEKMSELLSIPVFCERYRVSRSLAYRLMGGGAIQAVKIGRLTRIRCEDAERWAANLAVYCPAAERRHAPSTDKLGENPTLSHKRVVG